VPIVGMVGDANGSVMSTDGDRAPCANGLRHRAWAIRPGGARHFLDAIGEEKSIAAAADQGNPGRWPSEAIPAYFQCSSAPPVPARIVGGEQQMLGRWPAFAHGARLCCGSRFPRCLAPVCAQLGEVIRTLRAKASRSSGRAELPFWAPWRIVLGAGAWSNRQQFEKRS